MTQAEYRKLYLAARNRHQIELRKTMTILRRVYIDAAAQVGEVVSRAERLGLSQFTISGNAQIEQQLYASAAEISVAIEKQTPLMISRAYMNRGYLSIDERYIMDAVKIAGAGGIIKSAGIHNIGVAINDNLIRAMVNRMYQDGYTFSSRIWNNMKTVVGKDGLARLVPDGIFGDFQYRMKNVISAGVAQGRDSIKIAKDLQVYVKDGKTKLVKRYGKLVSGTAKFTKRIPGKVDWRCLRLVRSELYASMQDASLREGELNPACLDLYDWKKTHGNPIDSDGSRNASGMRCIDLEAFNSYKREDVPEYQHANCSCTIIPVLMDARKFQADLKRWANGENVPYIQDWYNNVYRRSAFAA